ETMCAPGIEIAVGAARDRQFGPMLMVGLGGIFVEVLRDVAFRLCPITRSDAVAMLGELRGAALLDGVRGGQRVDREAIVDLLLKIGGEGGVLATLGSDVAELDLNPVIAGERGVVVADARFVLAEAPVTPDRQPMQALDAASIVERFRPLFSPRTVAVVGAS